MTEAFSPSKGSFPIIGGGIFAAVVGPSGAGKDSVIAFARAAFRHDERVVFVRRCITRPVDGIHEDHAPMDEDAFSRTASSGGFALWWSAHGQNYGIPVSTDDLVRSGLLVVANLSRTIVPALAHRYRNHVVVEITASPEAIAARVAGRGRETGDAVGKRLARRVDVERSPNVHVIDNSDRLEIAGEAFVSIIRARLAHQAASA